MFFKLIGITITLVGCILFYLSHPNQHFLKLSLSKNFTHLGIVLLLIGLIFLLLFIPKLAATCIWIAVIVMVLSLIPFLDLFKRNNSS